MIDWLSNSEFKIGNTLFTVDLTHGKERRKSELNNFTIVKTKRFIKQYMDLAQKQNSFDNVLELGIFQGGGIVFMQELFEPKKIVGVELSKVPIPALDTYVQERGDKLKIYYGTSQSDTSSLQKIYDQDFNKSLDLVVDDASHLYEHTKTAFEFLFPKLNPGGMYIIEDWAWSFREPHQNPNNPWYEKPALANLIIEIYEEIATNTMVESILVFEEMAIVTKSHAKNSKPLFSSQARRGRDFNKL